MNEYSEIRDVLLAEFHETVETSESIFKLWFVDLEIVDMTDKKIVFTTITNVKKKILLNKYINPIRDAIERALGFPMRIEIYTTEEYRGGKIESPITAPDEDEDDTIVVPEMTEKTMAEEEEISDYIRDTSKKSLFSEYTFENFVEGASNRFARAACEAVAREPNYYNPLFIYGNSGLGKTHLLWAIINYMKRNHPGLKIVYRKCETFLAEMIEAIQTGAVAPFKERCR